MASDAPLDSTEAVPLTAATLRGMDERHSPTDDYRGDRPHRANHKTGSIPFCRTCRTAWPCDARRLLDAARTADPPRYAEADDNFIRRNPDWQGEDIVIERRSGNDRRARTADPGGLREREREHREETPEGRSWWRCLPIADGMQLGWDAARTVGPGGLREDVESLVTEAERTYRRGCGWCEKHPERPCDRHSRVAVWSDDLRAALASPTAPEHDDG